MATREPPSNGGEPAPLHPGEERRRALDHALHAAARVLPHQAPLGRFVHHNTLHALQHLPFHQAVALASMKLETEGYLTEAQFRAALAEGRIDRGDLEVALDDWLAVRKQSPRWRDSVLDRRTLALLALLHPLSIESEAGLRWRLQEAGALDHFRADVPEEARRRILEDDASRHLPSPEIGLPAEARALRHLWAACRCVFAEEEAGPPPLALRVPLERTHRDLLRELTGDDPAQISNPLLIRASSAFLDVGVAHWGMPRREAGFVEGFSALFSSEAALLPPWAKGLARVLRAQEGQDAETIVLGHLDALGVPPAAWPTYIERVLLQLPGWTGMFHRLETHPEDRERPEVPVRLMDFLAVRLTCDRAALAWVAQQELGYTGALAELPARLARGGHRERRPDAPAFLAPAFRLFQLFQLAGVTPAEAAAMHPSTLQGLDDALCDFDPMTRRSIWHEAYERHHRIHVLKALDQNRRRARATPRPEFQVWFCIDDREESIRRHLEEALPTVETLGVAGFFGLAIDFRGLEDDRPAALCPVVVTPAHEVHETVLDPDAALHAGRERARRLWGQVQHASERGSRYPLRGLLITTVAGLLSTFPLAMRILFPRLTDRLSREARRLLLPRPRTVLTRAREEGASTTGKAVGFTVAEQVARVKATLENVGLTRGFGRFVVLLGHGSISLNNPYRAAYECGACGGRQGGPNARLFAAMANSPEVRAGLAEAGIVIPEDTVFLGGLHNTSTDAIELYDLDPLTPAQCTALTPLLDALEVARAENARERCRRFETAPMGISARAALRHVEARAADLSQVRPELGHATNAVAVVGRRALTRGIFFDRRAFLISYDPTQDAEGVILERILAAVVPVCAGINLEYYFSRVDNERYGSGTKLPHNLTAWLGVMDGHSSDLRTGLPREMIEIHEPVRLVTVVEAPQARLEAVCQRQPEVAELVQNGWIQLCALDPERGVLTRYVPGLGYEGVKLPEAPLPLVPSSLMAYLLRRDTVDPLLIHVDAAEAPPGGPAHE